MRGIMPSHQEESSPCWHMGPIHAISVCIIRIMSDNMSLLFHIMPITSEIKNAIWVRIHCRKLANRHIHHWRSVRIKQRVSRTQSPSTKASSPTVAAGAAGPSG
jgi:hypothetical protein